MKESIWRIRSALFRFAYWRGIKPVPVGRAMRRQALGEPQQPRLHFEQNDALARRLPQPKILNPSLEHIKVALEICLRINQHLAIQDKVREPFGEAVLQKPGQRNGHRVIFRVAGHFNDLMRNG